MVQGPGSWCAGSIREYLLDVAGAIRGHFVICGQATGNCQVLLQHPDCALALRDLGYFRVMGVLPRDWRQTG